MSWWVLRRKVHSSWLVAVLSLGVIVGVVLAQYVAGNTFAHVVWLVIGVCLAAFGFWRGRVWTIIIVVIAGLVFGLWRGSVDLRQLAPYEKLIGATVNVVGSVSEDPDVAKGSELTLRLKNLSINGHKMTGRVWVSLSTDADIKRGDRVMITGKLSDGFGNFAASVYRAKLVKVQRPQPGDVAGRVRDWFAGSVRAAIPDPQASLGLGYLVGQRRALPAGLTEALAIAGLTHVVVASGYNLTILVRLARRLFVKISKYLSALAAGGMIVAFMAITGMSPSMSRAGLVAGLSLLAWYYGRKVHPLVLLPFAAAVTLLINPSYGWGDLGWQLSFAAFAGVMIMAPLAQSYFFGDKKPGTMRQILGETVAATIFTLPIIILGFGVFSNVALISNLLILPFVPLAMLLTFVAGIGALIFPPLATIIGLPASWLLEYMIKVAEYLAGLSWAQTEMNISFMIFALSYALIVAMCLYMWHKTRFNLRDANLVE